MIRPRFPVVTALFSSNRLKKKKKEERKKKEKEREKKKKRKKKFTGDNETNRARVIYRGLIHRYPGTILDDFSPTDCRSIVEIRLIPTYRSPLATGNFSLEIGEKIVAASRKKAKKRGKFRATSWHVHVGEIRGGNERGTVEIQAAEGGDKSFSTSCSLARSNRIGRRSGVLGVPDYRISCRVDRFFLIPRGFEIALIHAYNIPLSLYYWTFVLQPPNFLLKEKISPKFFSTILLDETWMLFVMFEHLCIEENINGERIVTILNRS